MYETNAASNMSAAPPTDIQRQSEVSNEMEQLAMNCEVLDKQLSELEERLMTVLAQRSEGSVDSPKNPEPVRVPLAQAVHDRNTHLLSMSDRIKSIISRIEV